MSSYYYLSSNNNHFYGPGGETKYYLNGTSVYTIQEGPTGYSVTDNKIYGPYGYTSCYLDESGYIYGYPETLPFFK
ncbi:hypothetical protein COY87_05080 [Candidatus Roizmanbacteria bacterium CG_4_10_14_0_8_um_filter_33_9]|uniref:Uncharacterized protein n=1 Tax=Candidatus Roizmanbacteria bacterium CG_4_10_14_0_8_um_filter_33_9 TaxID=1974826 RepID=A0A2M7QH36_9BACT|nr:MAG: hypothetical protein COY87_05080 [Candidatus Roizmanbacteria bacterium CG_4_10_14_0_8_um_filter_33_9]